MNRHNRQKRPNGRYLRAKCGQNLNQVAKGLIVWNQPELFLFVRFLRWTAYADY
jgi:hypothetical protein